MPDRPHPPTTEIPPTAAQARRSFFFHRLVERFLRKLRPVHASSRDSGAAAPALPLATKPTKLAAVTHGHFRTPLPRPVDAATRPLMRIAIVNHKGGVGKTSTAINFSAALAEMNYNVLVVDCDSQGDLSAVYAPGSDQLPASIANLFDGSAFVDDLIRATAYQNISIITADERLNAVDKTHDFASDPNVSCLANAVAALQGRYDFILFDCPPRPHLSAFAALCAATHVAIPCEPSQFSVRSMVRLMEEIDLAKRTLNPTLQLLGYFLSKVANRSATQAVYRKMLIDAFGESMVLKTSIPVMATLEAAINVRKPVVSYRPRSKAAAVMRQFSLELIRAPHAIHQ